MNIERKKAPIPFYNCEYPTKEVTLEDFMQLCIARQKIYQILNTEFHFLFWITFRSEDPAGKELNSTADYMLNEMTKAKIGTHRIWV